MDNLNNWTEDWLSEVSESDNTKRMYLWTIEHFSKFAKDKWDAHLETVVMDWRQAKRSGDSEEESFLDLWNDVVRNYKTFIKGLDYAPNNVRRTLAVVRSFFKFCRVPVEVPLGKRGCVKFHNRDLTRDDIKAILTYASPRDKVIWLIMAESGLRANTVTRLEYWMIKEDFEAEKIPMCIKTPASILKDRIGERFTFIGEDGFKALKEYLAPRMPLKDNDILFPSERAGKTSGKRTNPLSLSMKFNRLVKKLALAEPRGRKPKAVRMHGLRRYFRNSMKAETAYRKFWMGHSLGTDEHYITRDIEKHRQEYVKGYPYLRIYEAVDPTQARQLEVQAQHLQKQAARIERLEEELIMSKAQLSRLNEAIEALVGDQQELMEELWELKGGRKEDLKGTVTFKKKAKKKP